MKRRIKAVIYDDGAFKPLLLGDGFEGYTEDGMRDCTFMNGMSGEELAVIHARAEAAIREADDMRLSALKRLSLLT